METLQLTQDVSLSRIVQGLWRLKKWEMSLEERIAFIEGCIDLGVTSFDTAEIYGNYEAETLFGDVLRAKPNLRVKIQIITKTGINMKSDKRPYTMGHYDTRYDRIVSSAKKSIENMACGYLDVFLIHREDPLIDHEEVARALKDLKHQGIIKSYGVSNFDPFKFNALYEATQHQLVTNQIELNPLVFEHFNNGNMDYLQQVHVHPMIWSPLAGGKLFSSDEEAVVKVRKVIETIAKRHHTSADTVVYAWILMHPVKALPISGSSKLDRLKNAVDALNLSLTHEEWYEIYVASGSQVLR